MKLHFQNLTHLTSRDLLKVRFIKPAIFYINRTMSSNLNEADDIDKQEIDEVDRQGVELKGKNISAFSEQLKVEMNPNFKIEVFIPP